jgi:hypothetical protein
MSPNLRMVLFFNSFFLLKRQRWARALFLPFRARKREAKIRARMCEEKRVQKSKSVERKRKNANSRFFLPPTLGNPVSEPKAAWQGGQQGS